jgi:hypothetical protein
MRWVGVDEALDQVDKKIWTIKTKDQLNWLSRIKTHRYLPQAQLISDYTRLISRDPAVVSERVLERA